MGQDESTILDDSVPPNVLSSRSLAAVADYIKNTEEPRIVVLTGAGISTAAGIPDFRSPKTGLYSNLARLNLPHAEAVFDIDYFRKHPEPFYVLANELYPGKFSPTVSHAFIALLAKKGLLRMLFTQNIDCLERRAGVPSDKIVEAHGSFATQRCIECKEPFPDGEMKAHVLRMEVPRCATKNCKGLVKPDIVFFGEGMPGAFSQNAFHMQMADLVLVIGTSLAVYPFASLPDMAKQAAPRVLFNMERVGSMGSRPDDVLNLGPSDAGIRELADELGWRGELEALWKGVVGDAEAARQMRSQEAHEEEVEDEVLKLAEGVQSVLKIGSNSDGEKPREDEAVVPSLETAKEAEVEAELAQIQPGKVAHASRVMDDDLGSLLMAKKGPAVVKTEADDFAATAAAETAQDTGAKADAPSSVGSDGAKVESKGLS